MSDAKPPLEHEPESLRWLPKVYEELRRLATDRMARRQTIRVRSADPQAWKAVNLRTLTLQPE